MNAKNQVYSFSVVRKTAYDTSRARCTKLTKQGVRPSCTAKLFEEIDENIKLGEITKLC